MGEEIAKVTVWRRAARILWRGTRIVLVVYLAVLLFLMFMENTLVFQPATAAQVWRQPPHTNIVDVAMTSADGIKLHGWWCPESGSDRALLLLHGNGGNLSFDGLTMVKLRDLLKTNVLSVDYPGYGKSDGRPSETGCYAAAHAAYDWLTHDRKFASGQVVILGESLGGGVAVELASHKEHRALVLVKTFSSLPDVGQTHYPWLPVRWVMRNRFDSVSRIADCHRPVFIAHGTPDSLVPFALGQKLFEAANEPKELLTLACDHNDALPVEYYVALKRFLDQHSP